ncbi:hypothetical protein [Planococcus halotolerans]|uniref:Uncharacterized protein n=1 Tax=Planococcus halotolerans TaxID=2233542 RepID=A0A365KN62_9BACL|nr:hypothetical protein [Planococcus halotolerans]QHJ71811.1 hypothetical protein DNR44_014835 [Planococcus halotolerans]RAZ74571.1 hypothetical protein DP120_14675 [Planococcus halotolerans]
MPNRQEETVLETVNAHYINDEGTIHAYPKDWSSECLSESIGLYMQYLLQVSDEENFKKQVTILKDHFLIEKEGHFFIPWRLYKKANVNAMIDDVRIAAVLRNAAVSFSEPVYQKISDQILSAIEGLQHRQGIVTDYYDWSYKLVGNRLTLSYLIAELSVHRQSFEMLETGKEQLFSPEYYDFYKKQFIESKEVHMIDQFLIAINRLDQGIQTTPFENWLIEIWTTQQKVYGRYIRKTGKPAVDYESLAVYYYLWQYFKRIGQGEFAEAAFLRAQSLAEEEGAEKLHFFDFIHFQIMRSERHNFQ